MGITVTAYLCSRELEAIWAFITGEVDREMWSTGSKLEEIDNIPT